jgi:hydroxymethylbilane synthase
MRPLKIGTRASRLALTQSNHVADMIRGLGDNIDISLVKITTKGDTDKSDFLYKAQAVGFFTTEVENSLLDGRADIAVHSLKDLPTAIREGLVVAVIPKRESVADALVCRDKVSCLNDLPQGATVGTSSLRRIAQLKLLRPDLNCVPLRGNVDTRISKVETGVVDAAVIACAGLNRLGLSEKISAVLDPQQFLPAPAQGALAIQIRSDDTELAELIATLDDPDTRIAVEAERQVLAALHGGCSIPLGTYTELDPDAQTIKLTAQITKPDATKHITMSQQAPIEDAQQAANTLAQKLIENGAREILESIRG